MMIYTKEKVNDDDDHKGIWMVEKIGIMMPPKFNR